MLVVKKKISGVDDSFSFLFWNFPEDCGVDFLHSKFSEIAKVTDIFCPRKRDKARKRFGFIRFKAGQVTNVDITLNKLNILWINSYKLRVYQPKYDRLRFGNKSCTGII